MKNAPLFVIPTEYLKKRERIGNDDASQKDLTELTELLKRFEAKEPYLFADLPYEEIFLKQSESPLILGIKEADDGTYNVTLIGDWDSHIKGYYSIHPINKDAPFEAKKKLYIDVLACNFYITLSNLLRSNVVYRYKETMSRQERRYRERKGISTTVIYLSDKPREQVVSLANRHDLQQLESWYVRGHWRKTSGPGHNRQGDGIHTGFTWVRPHVRGDKNLTPPDKVYQIKEAV